MISGSTIRVLRLAFLTALCMAVWLLVSQDLHPVAVTAGAFFSVVAAVISNRAFFEPNLVHRSDFFIRFDLVVAFIALVVIQSYLSSVEIIVRMIRGDYRPGIVRIRTHLRSPVGRTVLANTISMIPGTLSLWLKDQHIYVHWFDKKTHHSSKARALITGAIEPLLSRIFG